MKFIILISLLFTFGYSDEVPKYNRKYFKHWRDLDHDCQSTRMEILIRDNINQTLMFKTDKKCKVIYGIVYDHYSGKLIQAKNADIDHLVPLKNAFLSGADKWTADKRELYANYMDYEWHLLPVSKSLNRSKGFKSPDQWMPPNKDFWIPYCIAWVRIKNTWNLTATQEEIDFIKEVLKKHDKRKKQARTYPTIRR